MAAAPPKPPRPGRPRKWVDPAAKHRAYRQRRTATQQALEALLHAVLNARLPNPELQQLVNDAADDVAVLKALTAYYRARRWQVPAVPE